MIRGSFKRRRSKGWVERLAKELKPLHGRVVEALVQRGVLAEERSRLLGLIPSTRYPAADPGPERSCATACGAVVLGKREPEAQDAPLLSLLVPLELVKGWSPAIAGAEAASGPRRSPTAADRRL